MEPVPGAQPTRGAVLRGGCCWVAAREHPVPRGMAARRNGLPALHPKHQNMTAALLLTPWQCPGQGSVKTVEHWAT